MSAAYGPMVLDEYGDVVAPLAVVLAQAWDDRLTPAQTLALVADPNHRWGTTPASLDLPAPS